jgi:hypothetical protein
VEAMQRAMVLKNAAEEGGDGRIDLRALPWKALSVRQPWAAMIIYLNKDIENRTRHTKFRGRFLIHASQTMTRNYWLEAIHFAHNACGVPVERLKSICDYDRLQLGGFIGSVELVDSLDASESRWYMGEKGFLLRDPKPVPFVRYSEKLGFFDVPQELFPNGL